MVMGSPQGNNTELIALALCNLDQQNARVGLLFGANSGSVTVRDGVDLTMPILDDAMDAERSTSLMQSSSTHTAELVSGCLGRLDV